MIRLEDLGVVIGEHRDGGFTATLDGFCEPAISGVALKSPEAAAAALLERLGALSVRGLRYYDRYGHQPELVDEPAAAHQWADVTTHNDAARRFKCVNCDGISQEGSMGIKCGDKVRDRVTAIEGIVTGVYTFISGPDRVTIEYSDLAGRAAEHTIDEERAVIVETAAHRERELRTSTPIAQAPDAGDVDDAQGELERQADEEREASEPGEGNP